MLTSPRRALVRSLGTATVAGLAGCLGEPVTPVGETDPTTNTETDTDPSPTATDTRKLEPPVQARGDPVTAEATYDDPAGYEDGIEYFPDNETVRFVSIRSGDEAVAFGEWSFAEWGVVRTGETALERTRAVTADRLGTDAFGSGVGQPRDDVSTDESFVVTLHLAVEARDSGAANESATAQTNTPTGSVTFPDLVAAAPQYVETTVSMTGDSYTREVPVFVDVVEVGMR